MNMPLLKRKPILILISVCAFLYGGCRGFSSEEGGSDERLTAYYYNELLSKKDVPMIVQFFTLMPKGGDLHHHYSGAIFAEDYLSEAKAKGLYVDGLTFKFSKERKKDGLSVDELKKNAPLYQRFLSKWSILDFYRGIEGIPSHRHFFSIFSLMDAPMQNDFRRHIRQLKKRAIKENVFYIETILECGRLAAPLSRDYKDALQSAQVRKDDAQLERLLEQMVGDIPPSLIEKSVDSMKKFIPSIKEGIDDDSFRLRFQMYALRGEDPQSVFLSLLAGFYAADRIEDVVGVNIVGPEHEPLAIENYWLHMRMFRFLKKKFPAVKTAIHAGELNARLVKPEELSAHIKDAVEIAGADRVGHGVDIGYEENAEALLKKMKDKRIAVELNLSSNEFILEVKGVEHPIRTYVAAGVPVLLGTDDAGIFRTSLSQEYAKVALRYYFSYEEMKSFSLNSIRYSFMKREDKERALEILNDRFRLFERRIAALNKRDAKE